MPTPDETPSRVLRANTVFPIADPANPGGEILVHNDNVHRVLADASDADLAALAKQGWITLSTLPAAEPPSAPRAAAAKRASSAPTPTPEG